MTAIVACCVLVLLCIAVACGGGAAESTTTDATAAPAVLLTATPNVAREVARGKRLAQDNACLGCHTIDGRDQVGPTWQGLYGRMEQFEGGGAVEVEEGYLRESIRNPNAKIVRGYLPGIMPTIEVTDEEIDALIAFIKSLR